jgi:hypothetical protein
MDGNPRSGTDHDDSFFFIVGAGRSGTTLLQALLADHPRLTVPPETHYLRRAMDWGADRQDGPTDFDAFWADLVGWSRFHDLAIDPDAVMAHLDGPGRRTFRDVFTAMLRAYADARDTPRVGEKTPSHYRHVARLLSWYPDARVLFVRRDPRAVVASQLSTPWVAEQRRPAKPLASFSRRLRLMHVAERASVWRAANGRFLNASLHDPRLRVVAYEALVTTPEETLRSVCDFLGEDYDAAMLARDDRTAPTAAPAEGDSFADWRRAHRSAAQASVSRSGLSKWKGVLTSLEVAVIEAICERPMRVAGYETVTHRLSRMAGRVAGTSCLAALYAEDRVRGIEETV